MRKVVQTLAVVALTAVSHVALAQISIIIKTGNPAKPIIGLPFTADQSVRLVQHYANGMAITHEVKGRVYRTAEGVERFDGTFADSTQAGTATMAYIIDPVNKTALLLNSRSKTALLTHLSDNSTATVAFLALPNAAGTTSQQLITKDNTFTTDLGQRTEGQMDLVGKRMTSTVPIGKIGNEQPIVITQEGWYYPQLKLLVKDIEQNPLVGERTYELTNIRSEEPDPALFKVPEGYTLKEQSSTPGAASPAQPKPATEQGTK